jgi:cysteine desulfurase
MEGIRDFIYLDNNATTQIAPEVLDEMMPFLTNNFANAASTHKFGVRAHDAVKTARKQVADLLGADTNEIIFTSGATEAINIVLKGIAEAYTAKGKHIITVQTEHKAVLDTCIALEKKGFEVTYLPVLPSGLIDLEQLKEVLREDTILVAVMHVNNETGVIQDIQKIAELTHEKGAFFFSDCTQSVGKIPINVDELGIDALCLSAHKIHGPKGAGALFLRQRKNRLKIDALVHGGGHERGLRSGTLNVPGIVGLGKACELAALQMEEKAIHIKSLRDSLEQQLLEIPDTVVNGSSESRLYNVTNIHFKGVDSDALIMGLSEPENNASMIAVSNGSACTAASIDPSHVLLAMGLNEYESFCCIRFSLSGSTTVSEINTTVSTIREQVRKLRSMFN